jgi:hypothetical protein
MTAASIDRRLTSGAVVVLRVLHLFAKGATEFVALTKSKTTALCLSTNTIRSQRDELASAGYLSHSTNPCTGEIRYTLLSATPPPGGDAPFRMIQPPGRPRNR